MTASTTPRTIHGASTIRSIPVIRIGPLTGQCCHYQCTRWICGSREADMEAVWRWCGGGVEVLASVRAIAITIAIALAWCCCHRHAELLQCGDDRDACEMAPTGRIRRAMGWPTLADGEREAVKRGHWPASGSVSDTSNRPVSGFGSPFTSPKIAVTSALVINAHGAGSDP